MASQFVLLSKQNRVTGFMPFSFFVLYSFTNVMELILIFLNIILWFFTGDSMAGWVNAFSVVVGAHSSNLSMGISLKKCLWTNETD
jgi:hypothetical protein